jgi:hypothetical protein
VCEEPEQIQEGEVSPSRFSVRQKFAVLDLQTTTEVLDLLVTNSHRRSVH